ncbi:uncharacterized protein LOC143294034 [Babylonia areolata]|uniref:uncharacterized protein LOC143294034 n=1 Tax=Babylonia areolata TaxID=304850 RepID=UPI003FD1709D
MGQGIRITWAVLVSLLPALHTVCVVTGWNYTVPKYGSYDRGMRLAISECFSQRYYQALDDGTVYVIGSDVGLSPDEWWPPGPLTSNMIQVMMAVCRSEDLRASTNHCINEVYLSLHGNDLQMDIAMAQLPVSEAWNEAQNLICMSDTLSRDLPCVHHLRPTLRHCLVDYLNRSDDQRFLVCRQVDAAEKCQREVYGDCSSPTSRTLAQVTRTLNPALCPPPQESASSAASASVHVTPVTLYFFLLVLVLLLFSVVKSLTIRPEHGAVPLTAKADRGWRVFNCS